MLAGQEELQRMNDAEVRKKILILKSPKFWKLNEKNENSWTNLFKGDVQWGFLYHNECEICKSKNKCKEECKNRKHCKLFVIRNDEGEEIVKIKRTNVNAKLPVRSTKGAAGYDLATAQAAVVPVHGKCLVKTGHVMALPLVAMGELRHGQV